MPGRQAFGDGEHLLAAQVDVEHRAVDLQVLVSRQGHAFGQGASDPDDGVAKVGEHVLDHHRHHRFVFDDKDSQTVGGRKPVVAREARGHGQDP